MENILSKKSLSLHVQRSRTPANDMPTLRMIFPFRAVNGVVTYIEFDTPGVVRTAKISVSEIRYQFDKSNTVVCNSDPVAGLPFKSFCPLFIPTYSSAEVAVEDFNRLGLDSSDDMSMNLVEKRIYNVGLLAQFEVDDGTVLVDRTGKYEYIERDNVTNFRFIEDLKPNKILVLSVPGAKIFFPGKTVTLLNRSHIRSFWARITLPGRFTLHSSSTSPVDWSPDGVEVPARIAIHLMQLGAFIVDSDLDVVTARSYLGIGPKDDEVVVTTGPFEKQSINPSVPTSAGPRTQLIKEILTQFSPSSPRFSEVLSHVNDSVPTTSEELQLLIEELPWVSILGGYVTYFSS